MRLQPDILPVFGGGQFLYYLPREEYLPLLDVAKSLGGVKVSSNKKRLLSIVLLDHQEDERGMKADRVPVGQKTTHQETIRVAETEESISRRSGSFRIWAHSQTAKQWPQLKASKYAPSEAALACVRLGE